MGGAGLDPSRALLFSFPPLRAYGLTTTTMHDMGTSPPRPRRCVSPNFLFRLEPKGMPRRYRGELLWDRNVFLSDVALQLGNHTRYVYLYIFTLFFFLQETHNLLFYTHDKPKELERIHLRMGNAHCTPYTQDKNQGGAPAERWAGVAVPAAAATLLVVE